MQSAERFSSEALELSSLSQSLSLGLHNLMKAIHRTPLQQTVDPASMLWCSLHDAAAAHAEQQVLLVKIAEALQKRTRGPRAARRPTRGARASVWKPKNPIDKESISENRPNNRRQPGSPFGIDLLLNTDL